MLTCIQSLRNFGIFDHYDRPAGTYDFSDRNVIYGWNYSGKTTLSRLFQSLNERAVPGDMTGCTFSVTQADGAAITHANVGSCVQQVRVFNSDFVAESLNWKGERFRPILLLGEEAQDAQVQIDHYEKVISRCTHSAVARRREAQAVEDTLSEAKTATAKQIKTSLGLVEAFTATHLNQQISIVGFLDHEHTLTAEQLASDLSLANSSEKDKLPPTTEVSFSSNAAELVGRTDVLLKQRPASASVIEALRSDATLSAWVSQGLHLHADATICAFCQSLFTDERRKELQAHFSREMTEHKQALESVRGQLDRSRFATPEVREAELNVQFRAKLPDLKAAITTAAASYNDWIDRTLELLDRKIADQFADIDKPDSPQSATDALSKAVVELNNVIKNSNAITQNYAREKSNAVKRLKNHFTYQFTIDFKTDEVVQRKEQRLKEAARFDKARDQASAKLKAQQARINRAQNGREKINERIATLLNSKAIQIDVVSDAGVDHFILKRHNRVAHNLSEGEKTAIAFAFFLTKLLEEPKLEDVIVYIDDPISSLDSNHIFQVYSTIRTTFFKKQPNASKSVTTCKQLFISTHNFEFFSMLRELPDEKRYFMTKRLSLTRSTLTNMPASVSAYPSEYHYLFYVLHSFNESPNKADAEHLLALPNAARRFLELYTYAKLPLGKKSNVDQRASRLFGPEKATRILKLLHHFSHLEGVERLMTHTNALADIEEAVAQLMDCVKADKDHYDALIAAFN